MPQMKAARTLEDPDCQIGSCVVLSVQWLLTPDISSGVAQRRETEQLYWLEGQVHTICEQRNTKDEEYSPRIDSKIHLGTPNYLTHSMKVMYLSQHHSPDSRDLPKRSWIQLRKRTSQTFPVVQLRQQQVFRSSSNLQKRRIYMNKNQPLVKKNNAQFSEDAEETAFTIAAGTEGRRESKKKGLVVLGHQHLPW